MVRVYRSDCWEDGNTLTRFVEYYHICPRCGDEFETINRWEVDRLCFDCRIMLIESVLFIEWFQLVFVESVLFWMRFSRQFRVCMKVYLLVLRGI